MLAMVTKGRHGLALADRLTAGFLRLLLAGAIALAGSALVLAATIPYVLANHQKVDVGRWGTTTSALLHSNVA